MRGIGVALLAFFLSATGGCTHVTANTSQFYLAQDYLPLPPAERDAPTAAEWSPPGHGDDCAAGPVRPRHRSPRERFGAQILAGMTLRVIQTSYAATRRDNAVPAIVEWQWSVPGAAVSSPGAACIDGPGTVPAWQRVDLLHVRSLLSSAQLPDGSVAAPGEIGPAYFAEAMVAACGGASGSPADLGCAEGTFLDRFVNGMSLNLRAQGQSEMGDPHPQPPPGSPFEANVPADVTAGAGAPDKGPVHYGAWYAALSDFRFPADLFANGLQAERCRGPFTDGGIPGEAPPAQNAPVCKFAQTSLEWSAPTLALRMPGATLQKVDRLNLLRSGDPLLLFQPENHLDQLDTGNGKPCGGDPACLLSDRAMQGFTDIQLLVPILLGDGERRWVPVGMSVAAFENANGLIVERISRSLDWLPASLSFEDGKARAASKLGGGGRRISLRFIAPGARAGTSGGVAIRSGKSDLLFAPGDIVTARRP